MIVEIPKQKSPYENFFVFEAPKKKKTVQVITVNPNKRNTDFSKNADKFDELPDDEGDMELVSDDELDNLVLDDEDYTSSENTSGNDQVSNPDNPSGLNLDDDENYETNEQPTDNTTPPNTQENEGQVEGGQSEEGSSDNIETTGETSPPMMDDENYSSSENETGDESGTQEPEQEDTSTIKPFDEQVKSYNLYKRFLNLYNAVKGYISKLDGMVKDSYDANLIIRTSTTQLRDIEDLLREYMVFQFQNASYVKSLLFYEKSLVSVQLVFNLLENINTNDTSNQKQ